MADKAKKKLGDYIVVELAKDSDGKSVAVEFNRENFTPEQWENLKKNASDAGTLVEQGEGTSTKGADARAAARSDQKEAPAKAVSTEDRDRIVNMVHKINQTQPNTGSDKDLDDLEVDGAPKSNGELKKAPAATKDDDLDDLEVERADAGGGGGGTLISRAAREVAKLTTGATPADGLERTNQRINKTTSEALAGLPGEKKQKGPVGALKATIEQDAADAALPPTGQKGPVGALKAGIEEGETPVAARDSIPRYDETQQPPLIDQALRNANTRPTMRFPDSPLDRAQFSQQEPPPQPGMIQQLEQNAGEFGKAVGDVVTAPINFAKRVLTPSSTPNEQQLAAREDLPPSSAAPTQIGAPPVEGAPATGPVTPPSGPSGALSMSVKTTTPGSGAGVPAPEAFERELRMAQGAAETIKGAERERVKVEAERERANADILDQKIKFTADNEKKRLAAENTYQETLNRGQQALNAIADERRALMNQTIDPDAYYTKGGVGRAVLNTISGALFGFTGQGQQFLNRLDNLAQQEVQNQQAELARKGGLLNELAADKKNVIAMAKEAGMSTIESLAAAKVSFYQSVQDQLAKVAAENPTLAMEAQKRMAEVDQKLSGFMMEVNQARQMAAHQSVQDRVAMMNANTNRLEAKARIEAAGAKAGKGVPMKPAEKKQMAEFLTMGDTLSRMSKEYREVRGDSTALTGAVSKKVGVGGSTKSARWDKAMDRYTQLIGKPLEGGVVREEDTKRYKGSYIPDVDETDEQAESKQRGLLDYAVSKYANEYNTHVATNAEGIENFPTPEAYKAILEEKMFGPQVPGEKPYAKR